MRPIVALGLASLVSCSKPAPARCPAKETVTEIHAAAFFFQQDDREGGVRHYQEALQRSGPRTAQSPLLVELLDSLGELATLPQGAFDERSRRAELVRVKLSEWECLPTETHQAMHRDLPPIPGAR